MEKLYTIRDACEILQIDSTTLRKWDREGKIKCVRLQNNFRRDFLGMSRMWWKSKAPNLEDVEM